MDRNVDKGQTVQSSMTSPSFFVLATDLTELKLTAGVDEAEIGKIRPGHGGDFTSTRTDAEFNGTVDAVRLTRRRRTTSSRIRCGSRAERGPEAAPEHDGDSCRS